MRADLVRELDTLCKAIKADGYEVFSTIVEHRTQLVIVIKLHDAKDVADVMKALSEAH